MGDNNIKSEERIIIMIDPFTKEAFMFNHTSYPTAEINGEVDAGRDDDGNHVLTINASFTFKKNQRNE